MECMAMYINTEPSSDIKRVKMQRKYTLSDTSVKPEQFVQLMNNINHVIVNNN